MYGITNDILEDHKHEVSENPSWRVQFINHTYPPRKSFFSYFFTDFKLENK